MADSRKEAERCAVSIHGATSRSTNPSERIERTRPASASGAHRSTWRFAACIATLCRA